MTTFHDEHAHRGWSRTRWLIVLGVLIAIGVAIALIVVYTGGGSGGGGGGGY